jgi:gamma-glutamyltranspeptidase/glutathione hydrolase
MKLKDVLAPALKIAEEGFSVSPTLHGMMKDHYGKLILFPETAKIFLKNGMPYEAGDRLALPDLARTYRLIAEKGSEVFYRGEIAEAIVKEMKAGGGILTKEDLAEYKPTLRDPVRGKYRGYEILSMPSPSSGGTHIIQLLNILEGYDMVKLGHNTPASIHILAEAMKRVFADRARYSGDADFVRIPTQGLLSKEYASEVRKAIGEDKVGAKVPPGNPYSFQSGGTTHSSYVDKEGNIVSLTQTINLFFASGVTIPGYGILMNDEMDDFVPIPGNPNSIAPRKRPISSMSPSIVLKDGKPFLSLGSPGSTRIITAMPQILMNVIDYGMNLQQAIHAPRIHCGGGAVEMESRIPPSVQEALKAKGHTVTVRGAMDLYFGGAQAVMLDPRTGKLYGAADPRRDGFAIGY